MKKSINEIKKMQRLAGLITESEYHESQLSEAKDIPSILRSWKAEKGDRLDYQTVANMIEVGRVKTAAKFILDELDTSIREMIMDIIEENDPKLFDEMFGSEGYKYNAAKFTKSKDIDDYAAAFRVSIGDDYDELAQKFPNLQDPKVKALVLKQAEKMKKQMNEIKRMQQLAGIIKEGNNAINSSAPDWDDYEGYEILLEQYFDLEEVTDKESLEIAMDNDLIHNLSTDILKRKGIQTPSGKDYDAYDSFQGSQEKRKAMKLATEFIIQFAEDTFIIDEQEAKELTSNYLSWANQLKEISKFKVYNKEGINEKYPSKVWNWDINEFGKYNPTTKTFTMFMDGDGYADYMDTEFPNWLKNEKIADKGTKKYREDIKNAVKEEYGPGVTINGEGFSY